MLVHPGLQVMEHHCRSDKAHLFVLLNLALLKHGEHVGGAAISASLPPLGLLWCLESKQETG